MTTALLVLCLDCFSQKKSSYPLYLRYGSHGTHKIYKYEISGKGSISINDSAFVGDIFITNDSVRVNNEIIKTFSVSDSSLQSVVMSNGQQDLKLYRLKGYDNKLSRLIKDTLGVKIFDKKISFIIDGDNIDYDDLIFQTNSKFIEAVTFWTTSTKRSIVNILNSIWHVNLNPKDFKGKEDLMNRIINNDKSIYSTSFL